jgi:hypothetical protein
VEPLKLNSIPLLPPIGVGVKVGVKVGVFVGTGDGVKVEVEIVVSVGTTLAAGAHEARIKATRKTVTMFLIFIDYLILQGTAQRLALPTGGWDEGTPFCRNQPPARNMLKKRGDSHPSGARAVLGGKLLK